MCYNHREVRKMDEKEKRFDEIDKKLSILFENMEYADYISFIKNNKKLNLYDKILGESDINKIPKIFRSALSDELLDQIEIIIDKQIKLIKNKPSKKLGLF